MDELVNLVIKKTGLPKETAQTAVNVVIGYLKDKLPPQFDAFVDSALAVGADGKLDISDAANMLSGFFTAAQTAKKK
jgi:hypothetical protein